MAGCRKRLWASCRGPDSSDRSREACVVTDIAESLMDKYPNAATFRFGDSEALCERLLDLVRPGKKTATCSAWRDFVGEGQAVPAVGCNDIAVDWDGRPAIVIETTGVRICRFDEVDEDFALAEGENDDLAGWRRDHQAYFMRNGGFSPDMLVVCERFRVVEVIA